VFLALAPLALAGAVAVFALLMLVWRYVSLGSIGAALVMPVAVALLGGTRSIIIVTLLIVVIVVARHRENITRLLAGTENRFKA
jgi:glycerol-3-phosphate acyltransferase PlsY